MAALDPFAVKSMLFFTGAGMSAESGVPTYRGRGGIWHQYNWEDYACQAAFDNNPNKVVEFHLRRREALRKCRPNPGHLLLAKLEKKYHNVTVITQNIDGLHQRAGSESVIELHGSLWRVRCDFCGIRKNDLENKFLGRSCECGKPFRPDIVWFGDSLDTHVINAALAVVRGCELFISVGTSGSVWPAAGFPAEAKANGARCLEINLEKTELSSTFDEILTGRASDVLTALFPCC
ncbi:MAG: NAD-dependent deacylase [FCB group bacterium]|nr:NAD-dependent deacylase [FCB group bacterium]